MKKVLITSLFAAFSFFCMAQPLSKKGEIYLPEEGDWAIGIDAKPFLDYIGNFFSEAENTAPGNEYTNTQMAIMGKRFIKKDLAQRASIRIGILSDSYRSFSPQFSTEATNTTVEDKYSRLFTNVYASYGIEKRKGDTRIQGFYGIEGGLGFGTENHSIEYGNKLSQENTSPERTEYTLLFQEDAEEVTSITEAGGFITEYKNGATFSVGARVFVGAEIFLFPKWSVGFEYGLGARFDYTGNATITSEQWTIPVGGTSEQFVTTITDEGGNSSFKFDNDNSGGSLFMFFYF